MRLNRLILSLVAVAALAAPRLFANGGTARGYTSTQVFTVNQASGDFLYAQPLEKKEKAYSPPTRASKSKTVKDDRKVIVTKDAVDTEKLNVKTVPPASLAATNVIDKSSLSTTAFDKPVFSTTKR